MYKGPKNYEHDFPMVRELGFAPYSPTRSSFIVWRPFVSYKRQVGCAGTAFVIPLVTLVT